MIPIDNGHFLESLVAWIRAYPGWSGAAVFASAMLESLLLVGIAVPGAALMLSVGALVALGALELWPTLAWATAGAIVGDGISFWVGYRYRDRLRRLWPFSRFTGLLRRGEEFFARHGGKSVVFGRFVGPVRAVIPTVAGMMGMTPARFAVVNVLSALAWAPVYILPGMLFGASLELASEVAIRLVLTVLLLIGALWLARALVRRVFLLLAPRANQLAARILEWSLAHPQLGRLTRAMVDPGQPEARGLAVLGAVLLIGGAGLSYLLWRLHAPSGPPQLDAGLNSLLQSLRTPWADDLLIAVTMLGDAAVYLPLAASVFLWLLWRRNHSAAWHWLAALGFGIALTEALQWALAAPQPAMFYEGAAAFAVPSGHTTVSAVLYGFLAALAAREFSDRGRLMVYMSVGALIMLIAFSRVYLGAHWFSDVAGGLSLGLAWAGILGIAYRRHNPAPLSAAKLLAVGGGALVLFGSVHIALQFETESQRYALRFPVRTLAMERWWQTAWRQMPSFRDDLMGSRKQPLTVQWAGDLGDIRAALEARGWQAPPPASARSTLHWLLPGADLAQLPVLPQVHAGRHEQILLTYAADPQYQWVLRLWPTNLRVQPGAEPLWIGTVGAQVVRRRFGLLNYRITASAFDRPRQALARDLQGWDWRQVERSDAATKTRVHWNGGVLLIRPKAR